MAERTWQSAYDSLMAMLFWVQLLKSFPPTCEYWLSGGLPL